VPVSRNKNTNASSPSIRLLTKAEAESEDRTLWHSKTPAERLAAAEQLRQAAYGYDPASARIQGNYLLKSLNSSGVEYLIIGGYAVIHHGAFVEFPCAVAVAFTPVKLHFHQKPLDSSAGRFVDRNDMQWINRV
jgi:hypothetical protein